MGYLIPVQELVWQIKRHPEQAFSILLWAYAFAALALVLLGRWDLWVPGSGSRWRERLVGAGHSRATPDSA